MKNKEFSRRSFLKQAAVVAAAPHLLMANKALGGIKRIDTNERVNLACIGIGNRGGEIIDALYETGLANIVAFCDVDMGAPHTIEMLKKFPDVPRFQDFRTMFDKMDNAIDAV